MSARHVIRDRRRRRGRRQATRQAERLERRDLLANLVGHWTADDLNATLDDGDTVTAWTDGVTSIAATASGQPRLVKGALGGRSAIRFDRSDGVDLLNVADVDSPLSGAGDFSLTVAFATATSQLNGGTSAWFLNTGLVDATGFFGTTADWGLVLNSAGQVGAGLGGPPRTLYSAANGLNDGQVHVATYVRSGDTLSLYVDGAMAGSLTGASTAPRLTTDFTIGAIRGGQFAYTGDIAELQVHDGSLTEGEVTGLHVGLQDYYTLILPVAADDEYLTDEDTPLIVDAASGVLSNDTNLELDPLTAILDVPPEHGTLMLLADGSFEYTPDPDYFGSDSFTYLARNRGDSNVATVTLTVTSVADSVTAVADSYVVDVGTPLSVAAEIGLLANDHNPDGLNPIAELVDDVGAGQLTLRSDGSFDYDPGPFVGDTTFRYRVRDENGVQNSVDVTLRVDTPPLGVNDQYHLVEEGFLQVDAATGVLANDSDTEGDPLTARLVADVAHGTLTLAADGSFEYSPDVDFEGVDQFTYVAVDGDQDSQPTTVQLQVANINDGPVPNSDRLFGFPNQRLTVARRTGSLLTT